MHNAAGDGAAWALHDKNAAYRAVVSELVSLIEAATIRWSVRCSSTENPPPDSPARSATCYHRCPALGGLQARRRSWIPRR